MAAISQHAFFYCPLFCFSRDTRCFCNLFVANHVSSLIFIITITIKMLFIWRFSGFLYVVGSYIFDCIPPEIMYRERTVSFYFPGLVYLYKNPKYSFMFKGLLAMRRWSIRYIYIVHNKRPERPPEASPTQLVCTFN